ncbi:MAG: WD40 repeat domain-containing protein [Prochloraceae cyanobacterium]
MMGFNAAEIAKLAFISAFAAFTGMATSRTASATLTPGFSIFVDIQGDKPQKAPQLVIVPETLPHSRSVKTPVMTINTFSQTKECKLEKDWTGVYNGLSQSRPRSSEQLILNGHTSDVTSVVFSPDGSLIASASFDNTVRIWDLSGNLLTKFTGHTDYVSESAI